MQDSVGAGPLHRACPLSGAGPAAWGGPDWFTARSLCCLCLSLSFCLFLCRSLCACVRARGEQLEQDQDTRADVEAENEEKETALHWAAASGHPVVVRYLLQVSHRCLAPSYPLAPRCSQRHRSLAPPRSLASSLAR
eukprot:3284081-Rhodomonas_salina.1